VALVDLRGTTPLQRRRTSPQKEGTTGIIPRVSACFTIGYFYPFTIPSLLVSCYLLLACHIGKFTIVAYLENLPFVSSLN
jgi:hypothetical protein